VSTKGWSDLNSGGEGHAAHDVTVEIIDQFSVVIEQDRGLGDFS